MSWTMRTRFAGTCVSFGACASHALDVDALPNELLTCLWTLCSSIAAFYGVYYGLRLWFDPAMLPFLYAHPVLAQQQACADA